MTTFADPDTRVGPTPPPTVLRGPAHADNYRVKVGRYGDRWYRDPLPYDEHAPEALAEEAYPSVSIVKGASGKDWTYVSLKRVAHADDLADIAARGYFERYERLKVVNQLSLSQAQRRGTNVHTWAESIAYGVPQTLPAGADGAEYFPIVDKFFDDYQPTLVAAEFVCIDRNLNGIGYGGTSDGIFLIDGKRYMLDWKSRGEDSDHGCYPEEAGQLGAYVGAEYVIVEDQDPANQHGAKRIRMPQLDGALIVSIKPDSYEVYPVDLPKAIDHFHAMHAWWVARSVERSITGRKWAPRRRVTAEPVAEPSDERREQLYARHAALPADKQAEFSERVVGIDTNDLDAVERLIADIENPPRIIDMARDRMEADRAREADRRLSAEGGPAEPSDVALVKVRWEMGGITDDGTAWIGQLVAEAEAAHVGFRVSELEAQRRVDIYCALTEYAAAQMHTDPDVFRGVVNVALGVPDAATPLGVLIGTLTTEQAALLRFVVTEIVEGRGQLLFDPDGTARWEPSTTSAS